MRELTSDALVRLTSIALERTAFLMAEPTIAGVAGYLRRQIEDVAPLSVPVNKGELLVPIRQAGTRPPFFLVPGGGGGETEFLLYAPLLYQLGDEQPVYGLQARGLDGVTPPHRDVESMAAAYVQAIRTVQKKGPDGMVVEVEERDSVRGGATAISSRSISVALIPAAMDVRYCRAVPAPTIRRVRIVNRRLLAR